MKFNSDVQSQLKSGVSKLAKAVSATLGPKGRNVMIGSPSGAPRVTKDGVSVAKEVVLNDHFENMGAQMVKEVATRTADKAGDGTTTATILADALVSAGLRQVNNGANPIFVKRGMDLAKDAIIKNLEAQAKPVSDNNEIKQVATVSANWDAEIGTIIANAMDKVGSDGTITVEESKTIETTLRVVDGMQFNKGYISPYFCKDNETECELENPYILMYDKSLTSINDIVGILQAVSKTNRPLLIIADNVEGEALPTFVLNNLRGTIRSCAVKAPAFGDTRKQLMEDIAVLTGGQYISEELGVKLENVTMSMLGEAKRVIVTKDSTTIIDGLGEAEALAARIEQIRKQINEAKSDYEQNRAKERLAKLSGGVAVISVGAPSEVELLEKKDRIDDALHATSAAIMSGILPGGGIALINQIDTTKQLYETELNQDIKLGIDIVCNALKAPLVKLCENAGISAEVIMTTIKQSAPEGNINWGYDVATDTYCDMLYTGIIDPARVTITALESAVSIAGLILTTECGIVEVPDKNDNPLPMGGYPGI